MKTTRSPQRDHRTRWDRHARTMGDGPDGGQPDGYVGPLTANKVMRARAELIEGGRIYLESFGHVTQIQTLGDPLPVDMDVVDVDGEVRLAVWLDPDADA